MPARTLIHHKENPFYKQVREQQLVAFTPGEYELNIMVAAITPAALRCLIVILSRLNADGSASAPLADLRKMIGSPTPTLSRALGELARFELIKKRSNGLYWVNPSIARSLSIKG